MQSAMHEGPVRVVAQRRELVFEGTVTAGQNLNVSPTEAIRGREVTSVCLRSSDLPLDIVVRLVHNRAVLEMNKSVLLVDTIDFNQVHLEISNCSSPHTFQIKLEVVYI